MYATVGDRIVIRGHRINEPNRDCEVIEVRGHDGEPPYVVRWEDSGPRPRFSQGPTRQSSTSPTRPKPGTHLTIRSGTMRTLEAAPRSGSGLDLTHASGTPRRSWNEPESDRWPSSKRIDSSASSPTRDLVRRAVARDLPLDARTDAVMGTPVISIQADSDIHEASPCFAGVICGDCQS